jgi:hypothetical protein
MTSTAIPAEIGGRPSAGLHVARRRTARSTCVSTPPSATTSRSRNQCGETHAALRRRRFFFFSFSLSSRSSWLLRSLLPLLVEVPQPPARFSRSTGRPSYQMVDDSTTNARALPAPKPDGFLWRAAEAAGWRLPWQRPVDLAAGGRTPASCSGAAPCSAACVDLSARATGRRGSLSNDHLPPAVGMAYARAA